MDIYEFSISRKITQEELYDALSDLLKIPQEKIGSSDEFYTYINKANQLKIGLEIEWQDDGFQTLVNFLSYEELNGHQQIDLAYGLSKAFNSEVAIGDVTSESDFSEGNFLIITPNEFIYKAYEIPNNEDIFDLKSCSDEFPLKGFLAQCKS